MKVVILTAPKNPPRSGPASARYESGRGNPLAEGFMDQGHDVIMWWDHPEGPSLELDPDLVVLRSSVGPQLQRARAAQASGAIVVNDPDAHEQSIDKLRQAAVFVDAGISHPRTVSNTDELALLRQPVVVKPRRGSSGVGVHLFTKGDRVREDELAQEFQDVLADYRVTVVDGQPYGWARRTPKPGEFRSNLAQGATMEEAHAPSLVAATLCCDAVAALGLHIAGVDLVMTLEGPVVLEVNAATTLWGPTPSATRQIVGAVVSLGERLVESGRDKPRRPTQWSSDGV